jgi:tetratricopeptide (TPR) repeat protein
MADILTSHLSHVSAPALVLSLFLLVVQCGTRGGSSPTVRAENEQPPELRELLHQGNAFYRSGEYLRAIQIYEDGYREAKRRNSGQSTVRFLNNLGGAQYEMFRYREATKAYLEARDLAMAQGNKETLLALCFNLSSLYFRMGEVDAARESAEQGLKMPGGTSVPFKSKLLGQYALIRRQQKDTGTAISLFKDAIQRSAGQGFTGQYPARRGPGFARRTRPARSLPAARVDARRPHLLLVRSPRRFTKTSGRSKGSGGALR